MHVAFAEFAMGALSFSLFLFLFLRNYVLHFFSWWLCSMIWSEGEVKRFCVFAFLSFMLACAIHGFFEAVLYMSLMWLDDVQFSMFFLSISILWLWHALYCPGYVGSVCSFIFLMHVFWNGERERRESDVLRECVAWSILRYVCFELLRRLHYYQIAMFMFVVLGFRCGCFSVFCSQHSTCEF